MPISSYDSDPNDYLGGVDSNYRSMLGYQMETNVRGPQGGKTSRGPQYVAQPVYGVPRYTQQDALNLYSQPTNQVWKWQQRLANAGMLTTFRPGDAGSTYSAYAKAMGEANREGIPLKDYLDDRAAYNAAVRRGGSGGGGGGGGGYTSSSSTMTSSNSSSMTSTSINLTGRGTAESILRNALMQELGRVPSDKEVGEFKRALNRSERKHPTVTQSTSNTTTTTTSKGSHSSSSTSGSSSSTTKNSDVDPSEKALDFAQSKPFRRERQQYQDMQYYDAIGEMLGL